MTQDEATGATIFPDFAPIVDCIWQFGGNGTSFPLAPGADAVIAVNGAIDHAAQYPLSVNLNKPGYFACYNNVYYRNTMYHPAPGDQISRDHYLDVVINRDRRMPIHSLYFLPPLSSSRLRTLRYRSMYSKRAV